MVEVGDWGNFLKFLGAGIAIGLGGLGSGIGMGFSAEDGVKGISIQPGANNEIFKTMLIGQAGTGSASIFALVIAIILVFIGTPSDLNQAFAYLSAGIAIGLGGLGSGYGAGLAGKAACEAAARQPRFNNTFLANMLVGQAVVQTPIIFALVVSLILIFMSFPGGDLITIGALLGAGISIGLGSIGSGIGTGMAAEDAIKGMGKKIEESGNLLKIMLLGQAVAQTPTIFALLVSFILLFIGDKGNDLVRFVAMLSAGIAMGAGAIGPGIGSGSAAQGAAKGVSENPEATPVVMRTMLLGQAVAQSTSTYALVIAFILIFVVK